MKKRRLLFLTGLVIFISILSMNVIFSTESDSSKFCVENLEALAQKEDVVREEVMCASKGTVCVGLDAKGLWGCYPGLMLVPKK